MSEENLPAETFSDNSSGYGGVTEKGLTWKISEKKIAAWTTTSLYLHYKPKDEEEAKALIDKKRIKFRQIEWRDGVALATLLNGKGKIIAQTSILNFIEYETGDSETDSEPAVHGEQADDWSESGNVEDGSELNDSAR